METQVAPQNDNLFFYPKNKRRQTVAGILNEDRTKINIGVSQCHEQDKFVKKNGRTEAMKIAILEPKYTIDVIDGKPRASFANFCRNTFKERYKMIYEVNVKDGKTTKEVERIILL